MNYLRFLTNSIFSLSCAAAGLALLNEDSINLKGCIFSGISLYLLAASFLFLSVLAGAIARDWHQGSFPMPSAKNLIVTSNYKGELLVRHWFLSISCIVCLSLSFLLAR